MSYQQYSEMKDTDVEWLGQIPSHWETLALKRVLSSVEYGISASLMPSGEVAILRMSNIQNGRVILDDLGYVDDVEPNLLLRENDLLFNRTNSLDLVGKVGIFKESALPKVSFASYLVRFRTKENAEPKYLCYFLNQREVLGKAKTMALPSISQANLNPNRYGYIRICLPPKREQYAIVNFLDRKTAEIDALAEQKEKQIGVLRRKRQSLISKAVTRGLDREISLRASGVKWLGDIPGHWEVKKIKYVAKKIGSGKTPKGGAEVYVDKGVVFLRSQNVYDDGLRLDDVVYITETIDEEMRDTRVFPNDVLLNITGASIGRTCIVPHDLRRANVNQHVCIIRLKDGLEPEFIAYFLKSNIAKGQIQSLENGSSREGLNFEQVGNLVLALPVNDIHEQRRIIEHLNQETSRIDRIIKAIQNQIEELHFYRQTLISSAVTGKIDVRGEQQ